MPKRKTPTISYDELRAEIERLRPQNPPRKVVLTKEQEDLLVAARIGDNPVPWHILADWWRQKFGWGSRGKLWEELRRILQERGNA